MKYIAIAIISGLFVSLLACEQFTRATSPAPGERCEPFEVECADAWGGCCPPVHECRPPIESEGRPAHCANVDDAHKWSTVGARSTVARTPKGRRSR